MSALRRCLLAVLGTLLGTALLAPAYAQKPPLRWGKLSDAERALTAFPADTNATAVVLYDYGTVYFDEDLSIRFERHRRIKILGEGGYDWGTHAITYLPEDKIQHVSGVRAQTLLVDEDGDVTRHRLSKKEIFDEDVDGRFRRIRFTLPQLRPGAIVEYQYTVSSRYPQFLPEWQFQYDQPVLWSEYIVELPPRLQYVRATRGVSAFDIEEASEANRPGGKTMVHRYVLRDVPALREEPYMTTPNDFRARLEFQLARYYDGIGWQPFMRSWDEVARELMGMNGFGRRLDRERDVRRTAEALTAGLTDPVEKLRTIYDFVRTGIAFDGEVGLFLDQDIDEVLETKSGSSPEIALLLTSLLRGAGLEAHPVLISTRSHGSVVEIYPLLNQFNDVIVYAEAGGEAFLLDATDPLRPHTLLPVSALNGKGWLVRKDAADWIAINATGRYVSRMIVEAEVDAAGGLAGTVHASDDEYGALQKRRTLDAADDEAAAVRRLYLDGHDDALVDGYTIERRDSVMHPLGFRADFSIRTYAQAAGDFLYLNPTVFGRTTKNPLTLETRTFPVDFAYPFDFNHTFRITLPEGYDVQELPAPVQYTIPSGDIQYFRQVEQVERTLTMQTRFRAKRPVFHPNEYTALRAFYDQVVAVQGEQVVLKRHPVAEAPPTPASEAGGQ